MAAEIPDDMLDEFCIYAPYDELPKAIEQRFGGMSDTVEFGFEEGTDPELAQDVIGRVHRIESRFEAPRRPLRLTAALAQHEESGLGSEVGVFVLSDDAAMRVVVVASLLYGDPHLLAELEHVPDGRKTAVGGVVPVVGVRPPAPLGRALRDQTSRAAFDAQNW